MVALELRIWRMFCVMLSMILILLGLVGVISGVHAVYLIVVPGLMLTMSVILLSTIAIHVCESGIARHARSVV